ARPRPDRRRDRPAARDPGVGPRRGALDRRARRAAMDASIWVPGLLILVGLLGIVVPILPGLVLVLGAVLLWAWDTSTTLAWWVFGICAVLFVAGMALQYL